MATLKTVQLITCFCPTVALGYGSWQFGDYEKQGVGAQFSNWNADLDYNDNWGSLVNIMEAIIWMFADGFIYYLLGWYIDNVFPGKFGVPRKFYFFLQPSFWTGKTKQSGYDDMSDYFEGTMHI